MSSFQEKKEELSKDIEETKESLKKSMDSGVKKTKSFVKKLMWMLLLAGILSGVVYYAYANYAYSDGSRTGYLIKMSRKGYVFKTFEGQMNLGGIQSGEDAGIIGNIWNFSVSDPDLYKELEQYEGKKITLRYKEHNQALFWQGDTNYFVYEVEEK